jgi:hypothetical protein
MLNINRKSQKPAGQASVDRYASGSVIARCEAVLITDSREMASSVRSQAFIGGWSKLYQAGTYYLDLSLKMDGQAAVLLGHVLPPVGEHQVKGRVRVNRTQTELGPAGDFRIEVDAVQLKNLEVELENVALTVRDLDAST